VSDPNVHCSEAVGENECRQECMPGLKAHAEPGHTPGHLVFVIEGKERDAIFTGDAGENRAELLSRKGEATYRRDAQQGVDRADLAAVAKAPAAFSSPATTCR